MNNLCERAERLCRTIAHMDLIDAPIYIVMQSQLPADRGGASVCDGFTTPMLDLYLQDVIGSAWLGRGPCMVIRDIVREGEMDEEDVETAFIGIVLHELAHILARPSLYAERDVNNHATIFQEAAAVAKHVSSPPRNELGLIPFFGHGVKFIRVALHLCHRAQAVGTAIAPQTVFDGVGYCLSRTNQYRTALGAEPRRLAHASMREILDTPYPKAYWRLWTTDVAQWLTHCSPEVERSFSWF